MKIIIFILAIVLVADIGYEAIRFAQRIRTSTELIEKTRPYERHEGSFRMLVLGDSTAYGVGATDAGYTVPGRLAQLLDASVENYSKSGAVTAEIKQQFAEAEGETYDLILIQVGANDVTHFHSPQEANREMEQLLTEARASSPHVVLLTAGKIGNAPIFPWFIRPLITHRAGALRALFKATADHSGTVYVDLFSKKDPFDTDPGRYYAADGLHLTDDGYSFWFEATVEAIRTKWPELIHG